MSILWKNLCKFLSSRTSFCFSMSINPQPPFSFGMHAIFYAVFWWFSVIDVFPLHKQCFLKLSIFLMTFLGSFRVHMKKVGKEVKTAFVSSSLPAWDRKLLVLVSLLSHLFIRGMKSCILGLVSPRGNPRYVNGSDPLEQPKVLASRSSLSSVILTGSIMDFFKFTLSPVDSVKVLMTDFRKKDLYWVPLKNDQFVAGILNYWKVIVCF